MLMVIGMAVLRVDTVERRPASPRHNPPSDLSAHHFSSPPL